MKMTPKQIAIIVVGYVGIGITMLASGFDIFTWQYWAAVGTIAFVDVMAHANGRDSAWRTYRRNYRNVGLLRQWLNEDRITDPKKMVRNEDIEHWLNLKD